MACSASFQACADRTQGPGQAEARRDRGAGGPLPHDGRGPLVGDAHGVDRPGVGQGGQRHLQHGVGHQPGVELDQAWRGRLGEDRRVVGVRHRGVGSHDGGAHARGPDVDDQYAAAVPAHDQGEGPKGEGRPSFPGLRIPAGSKLALRPTRTSKPEPNAAGRKRDRLRPMPVVMADGGAAVRQGGAGHRVPGLAVEVLAPLACRPPRPAAGEGEVEAGAVGVGVETRCADAASVPSIALSEVTTSSKRPGSAAHGPAISAVSTTMPARQRGARAETSLRCPSQRSTRATSSGSAPAWLAPRHPSTWWRPAGRGPVSLLSTMSTLVSGCSKFRADSASS